jgi:hypothetical protein
MFQAAFAAQRRLLGSAHPYTLGTAECLESVRSQMLAKQPAKKGVNVRNLLLSKSTSLVS